MKRIFLPLILFCFLLPCYFCLADTTLSVTVGGGNPIPVLTNINPSSKVVNDPGFTMTLNGSNFIASSVVRFNGSARSTTFLSANQLQAQISSSDLTTVGDFNITVFNPAPGGGESNRVIFSVVNGGGGGGEDYPVPIIISINPSSKVVNDPGFTMTLNGSNFIASSVVRFNGSARSTTFLSANQLQAQISSSDLTTVGDFNITVFNPAPGGGESGVAIFTVRNPVPTLISINPSSKNRNEGAFSMTLTGTRFISSSIARFNGADRFTTYVNESTIVAQILASDLTGAGDFNITVFNPAPGGGESNSVIFKVSGLNPAPQITSIDPSFKIVGEADFTLTVNGSNFIAPSIVRFNGANRLTTFINSNKLQAKILSSDLTTIGTFNITVFNPAPGGGESNAVDFLIFNPEPKLTYINPIEKERGETGFIINVFGQNFISSSVVRFNYSNRPTIYLNATTLQAEISSADLLVAGTFNITVFNPAPGGGESNGIIFSVKNKAPTLLSINPSEKNKGDSSFVMTLYGSDFLNNSVVKFNGFNRSTDYLNNNILQAQILTSDLRTLGTFNITVFNPAPGGGESGAVRFLVKDAIIEEPPEEKPGEGGVNAPVILKPLDGFISNKKIIEVEGTALANKKIDLFDNDKKLAAVSSNNRGVFGATISLEEGIHLLAAELEGKRSRNVKITIDLTPPPAPKLLEINNLFQEQLINKFNVTLKVKGESSNDTALLKFVINSPFVFTFIPDNEQWEKSFTTDLAIGSYQIYALAYDLAGNESLPSNILTFKISKPVSPPPVIKEVKNNFDFIRNFTQQPEVKKTIENSSQIIIPTLTVLSIGAAIASVASTGLSLFQILSALYLFLTQPFVYIFSRRKRRGWGVVYNSLTKQPVDLAVVRLYDAKINRLVSTKVTDREGRYVFIVNPGFYKISVDKQEFKFPSEILKGFNDDLKYLNLYHGGEIEVKEKNAVINASIPLDPVKEFKANRVLIKNYILIIIKKLIPIIGFVLSFIFYLMAPNLYLLIFFLLNLILYFVITFINPHVKKDWGIVGEKATRRPLPLTIVRVFESNFHKLLDQQVTNLRGQYGFLIGGRKFYLTYDKDGYQEKKSDILDFENKTTGLAVNLNVYLEKASDKNHETKDKKSELSTQNKDSLSPPLS